MRSATATGERDSSPYVGPRPFTGSEREVFFGREAEVAQLVSLVIAHRLLVLYAVSGAGKTSLLRAGLIPALREEGFDVLPPVRVYGPAPPRDVHNAYTYGVVSRLLNDPEAPPPAEGRELDPAGTLWAALDALERGQDRYGFPAPRLLAVDQFEELFTLHAERWREREGFLRDVADACERDPELRVILSLREEFLGQLERHAGVLPDMLRSRFHLDRLRTEPALEAVTRPLAARGVSFGPGVAERLVGDLQQTRVDVGSGEAVAVEGEFVEPVHLQVVCRSLWERLAPGQREVTADDLSALGSVDESLIRYYDEAVHAAGQRARVAEHRLRAEVERSFITSAGTRATVFGGADETAHLPSAALDELTARHLIRTEQRAGGRWLEFAHDRLIGPVRTSNARYRDRRRRRRRPIILGLAALAVAAVTTALLVLGSVLFGSSQVVVPMVVGSTSVFDAQQKLRAEGLTIGVVTEQVTSDVPPGAIVDQSPAAGKSVKKGSPVAMVVGVSPARVTVPDLVGSTVAQADAKLRAQGLRLGLSGGAPPPRSLVSGQKPSSGKKVNKGSTVQVFLLTPVRADLGVTTLGIDQIGNDVVLTVEARNHGPGDAPRTSVVARATGLRPVRAVVGPLKAGSHRRLEIHLPITDRVRGRSVVGAVTVDPGNFVLDTNANNDTDRTAGMVVR